MRTGQTSKRGNVVNVRIRRKVGAMSTALSLINGGVA